MTAARRGVEVDIVVPAVNNLVLVDRAMTAQFDQILKNYCRIWRSTGSFSHSKLLTIDGTGPMSALPISTRARCG